MSPTVGTLCSYDPATRLALYWAQAAEHIPPWEIASPLRAILGWWALENDDLLVHGAAVGWAEDGLLLTAQGGSGKSTTALACLQAGLNYTGDDYVLLSGQAPDIYSLYNTAKLYPQHLHKTLPELAKCVFSEVNPDYDKVVLDLPVGGAYDTQSHPSTAYFCNRPNSAAASLRHSGAQGTRPQHAVPASRR